jgi:hypothetical protein
MIAALFGCAAGELRDDKDVPSGGAHKVPHHATLPVREPSSL